MSGASESTSGSVWSQAEGGRHVIVCGGGVIGCCPAYYLGKLGAKVSSDFSKVPQLIL